ncbi:PadR family transcriptional regulator [Halobiforma nitratireducens]|uniref:PadR family transcriptional regulator n=1 Tax=Halobiforma nitratireducens JCM 10879 TaxID=1227454 RepID=M0LIX6_9EURY|nr:helix-turn-helix transcriptional regulator [Halobiforma nitratireducens]EMA32389.1 PadR family transcriptional regulator [Halobiforma nitratireducens JCM 10879]
MEENATSTRSVLEVLSRMTASRERTTSGGDEGHRSEFERREDGPTANTTENATAEGIEPELDDLLARVEETLPYDDVSFDEALIKANLDEVLLVLIALHGETHGKQLLADLSHGFDASLSPGTVYPALHDLEEEDVLSMHAKVQTKEYSIADEEYVHETVERTMVQHLSFGLLLYAFLERQ